MPGTISAKTVLRINEDPNNKGVAHILVQKKPTHFMDADTTMYYWEHVLKHALQRKRHEIGAGHSWRAEKKAALHER